MFHLKKNNQLSIPDMQKPSAYLQLKPVRTIFNRILFTKRSSNTDHKQKFLSTSKQTKQAKLMQRTGVEAGTNKIYKNQG